MGYNFLLVSIFGGKMLDINVNVIASQAISLIVKWKCNGITLGHTSLTSLVL
jgi:hypothetical protein